MNRVAHAPHVYLTNTPVSFDVVISDQMADVSFEYTWKTNGTVVDVGHLPRYTYTFDTAGWYSFRVHVNMSGNDTVSANTRRNGVFEKHMLLKGNGNMRLFNLSGTYTLCIKHYINCITCRCFISFFMLSPFFLTFRDHLHIFVGRSSPSRSSAVCFHRDRCHFIFVDVLHGNINPSLILNRPLLGHPFFPS